MQYQSKSLSSIENSKLFTWIIIHLLIAYPNVFMSNFSPQFSMSSFSWLIYVFLLLNGIWPFNLLNKSQCSKIDSLVIGGITSLNHLVDWVVENEGGYENTTCVWQYLAPWFVHAQHDLLNILYQLIRWLISSRQSRPESYSKNYD
jgi:hypothetical protein